MKNENLKYNLLADVSNLTKISSKSLEELIKIFNLCIGSAVADAKLFNSDSICLDLGIGLLAINLVDMQCKFIPSKDLKDSIKSAIEHDDPLKIEFEESVTKKITELCSGVI